MSTIKKTTISSKVKEENEEKKIRRLSLEEMTKKDMEIKTLKESILKLKVEKNMLEAAEKKIINMNSIREEMKIADKFIKSVMQDNIVSYKIAQDLTKEDMKVHKSSSEKKEISKKIFERDALSKINYDNCKCATCIMNKSLMGTFLNKDKEMISKTFSLSDRVMMSSHFDSNNLTMSVINQEQKLKEIVFKTRGEKKDLVRIKLLWKDDNKVNLVDVRFDNHKDQFTFSEDMSLEYSLSAFLVVRAMRDWEYDPLKMLDKNRKFQDSSKENKACFRKMVAEIIRREVSNPFAVGITDLTTEEEMCFLTLGGDLDIFYKIDNKDMNSPLNHVSLKEFDESTKMKAYMLVTPILRNVCFFNDEEEDYVEVDFDLNLNEERMEEDNETLITSSSAVEDYYKKNLYKKFIRKFGHLIGDFYKNIFMKRNSDKGLDHLKLEVLLNSSLSSNFIDSSDLPVNYLYIANISYEMFLAILFFCKNSQAMVDFALNKDLSTMTQSINMARSMFYEMLYSEKSLEYCQKNASKAWVEFLKSLPKKIMFADDMYARLFWEFKRRVFYFLMMSKTMKDVSSDMNSMSSSSQVKETLKKEEDWITLHYMNFREMAMTDMIKNISNYQPTPTVRSINRIEPLGTEMLDLKTTEHLFSKILEEENLSMKT
jgi:hypothetical protein